MAHPVLRHRIITNFNAEAEGMSPDDLVDKLLQEVPETLSESPVDERVPEIPRSEDAG